MSARTSPPPPPTHPHTHPPTHSRTPTHPHTHCRPPHHPYVRASVLYLQFLSPLSPLLHSIVNSPPVISIQGDPLSVELPDDNGVSQVSYAHTQRLVPSSFAWHTGGLYVSRRWRKFWCILSSLQNALRCDFQLDGCRITGPALHPLFVDVRGDPARPHPRYRDMTSSLMRGVCFLCRHLEHVLLSHSGVSSRRFRLQCLYLRLQIANHE